MKPSQPAVVGPTGGLVHDMWNTPEGALMSTELVPRNKPVFDALHPKVYGAAVGLIAWFALMAWVLFDRGGQTGLTLTFVSLLFVVAVLLTWVLSLLWKKYQLP